MYVGVDVAKQSHMITEKMHQHFIASTRIHLSLTFVSESQIAILRIMNDILINIGKDLAGLISQSRSHYGLEHL